MENNKVTAVEWLWKKASNGEHLTPEDFQKALQMEKEQIKKAYLVGDSNGCGCYDYSTDKDAEQYYEKTYGK